MLFTWLWMQKTPAWLWLKVKLHCERKATSLTLAQVRLSPFSSMPSWAQREEIFGGKYRNNWEQEKYLFCAHTVVIWENSVVFGSKYSTRTYTKKGILGRRLQHFWNYGFIRRKNLSIGLILWYLLLRTGEYGQQIG